MIGPPSTRIHPKIQENGRLNPYFKVNYSYLKTLGIVILIRPMNNKYLYFINKDCIGAIDGTHVQESQEISRPPLGVENMALPKMSWPR
jgi:hypothetical protein